MGNRIERHLIASMVFFAGVARLQLPHEFGRFVRRNATGNAKNNIHTLIFH